MTLKQLHSMSLEDLEKISLKDLLFKHSLCHALFHAMKKAKRDKVAGLTFKELKELHDKIVKVLEKKGVEHHVVDEELDRVAERHKFLPFRIKYPFISLVGSIVATPGNANDVDLLVNGDLTDGIVKLAIGIVKSQLEGIETHFIDYFYFGPFSPYVPVFALTLQPHRATEITFGFAPLLPKSEPGRLRVGLEEVLNRLHSATLISPFIYFDPRKLTFAHKKVSAVYSVPILIRLTRMFPERVRHRIRVKEIFPNEPLGGDFVPLYDLVLERVRSEKIEM